MPSVLLAPLAAIGVLAAAAGVLAAQRWWQRRLLDSRLRWTGSGDVPLDPPDILYFTGENCTVCHVAQRPALRRLHAMVGDLTIREIDVARDPATARRYRVMTLPTTVVLDASGRTASVNVGYASESVLRGQVEAARTPAMEGVLA